MIAILLALLGSLATSYGGKTGGLIVQIVNSLGVLTVDKAAFDAFAGPWFVWLNAIVDANRDPTPEENAAAVALADAIHANNQSLGHGGQPVALPPPPAA